MDLTSSFGWALFTFAFYPGFYIAFGKFTIRLIKVGKIKNKAIQRQPPEAFFKKGVLRNFAKFTGKHLWQSLFFNKVAVLRPKACNFIKKEESAKWGSQRAHVPYVLYVSYVPYVLTRPTCSTFPTFPTCPGIFYRPEN